MCVAYSPVAVAIQGRLHAHRSFLMQQVGGKTSAGISRYPEGRMPAEGVETYTGIFGNGRNGRTDEPDETDVGEQVEVLLVGLSIP